MRRVDGRAPRGRMARSIIVPMVGMSSRVSMGERRRRRGWKENQGPMLDTRTRTLKTCTKRMLCQRQDTRDTQPYTGKTDGRDGRENVGRGALL